MFSLKNLLIKKIVQFLKLFAKKGKDDRFLIVSTTGLGDSLWATPAIRALRAAHPNGYIALLTTPLGSEVFHNNPYLNSIFTLKRPLLFSLIKLYFQLIWQRFGNILLFHTSQRAVLPLSACLGAQRLIGTAGLQKGLDIFLTTVLPNSSMHEIERRLEIARVVGAKPQSVELDFFIENVDRIQASQIVTQPFVIGLHPGAKDAFKKWPIEHFAKVGKTLRKELNCSIVVTGSFSERKLVEALCEQIGNATAVIYPLRIMGAILEKLSLFITNDTGPLHLALAMKTATISLFTPTNPDICGPYLVPTEKNTDILKARPTCFPCLKKQCRDPFCLRQISPEMVIATALKQLRRPS